MAAMANPNPIVWREVGITPKAIQPRIGAQTTISMEIITTSTAVGTIGSATFVVYAYSAAPSMHPATSSRAIERALGVAPLPSWLEESTATTKAARRLT